MTTFVVSRDSSVGILTAMGRRAGVGFPAGTRGCSLLYSVQTGSGAHPATYQMGTGCFSAGIKRSGREAHHLHPSSAEVKNDRAITPLPHTDSWPSATLIKHRNNFTFTTGFRKLTPFANKFSKLSHFPRFPNTK
jgi:hypothetical protein